MIQVVIQKNQDEIQSITVTGHAEFDSHGQDLVCAGVSSILFGTLNALDEIVTDSCDLIVEKNKIKIQVKQACELTQTILQVTTIQLKTIEEQYKDYIKIIRQEV